MKFEPVGEWMIGVAMLHKRPKQGLIETLPTAKDTSRCYLLEEVGPEAAKAGYKPGDIVVAKSVFDLYFYGGIYHRVTFERGVVITRVLGTTLAEYTDIKGRDIVTGEASVQAEMQEAEGQRAAS